MTDAAPDRTAVDPATKARQSAQQFVATALIQPILDQMQNDPFQTAKFHGGTGEKLFAQQLHTALADRIAGSARLPIVDAVYRKLMHQQPTVAGAVDVMR